MTIRIFDDWIGAYMQYTELTDPPACYRKWTAIGTVAAALQRKCWGQWTGGDKLHANMYIVLLGPSATRKSVAMSAARRIAEAAKIKMCANATTLQALIAAMQRSYTPAPTDNLLDFGHSSLTVFSGEFTVFLGYNDREMLAHLCDLYDCAGPSWIRETRMHGVEEVIGHCLNIVGGTTPASLHESLPPDAVHGGFTSRVIFVCARKKGQYRSPFEAPEKAESIERNLIHDLEVILSLRGEFRMSDNFRATFDEFAYTEDSKRRFKDKRFASYEGRRLAHIYKLCMIMNASRTNSMLLEPCDLERAVTALKAIELNMYMAYEGFGLNTYAHVMHDIMALIKEEALRDPQRHVPPSIIAGAFGDMVQPGDMAKILSALEIQGRIRINDDPKYIAYLGDGEKRSVYDE